MELFSEVAAKSVRDSISLVNFKKCNFKKKDLDETIKINKTNSLSKAILKKKNTSLNKSKEVTFCEESDQEQDEIYIDKYKEHKTNIVSYLQNKEVKKLKDYELLFDNREILKAKNIANTFRFSNKQEIKDVLEMKNKESQIKTKHWAIKNQLDYRFFLDKKYLKDLDDKEKKKIKKNLREKQTFIEQMSENDSILHQTVFFNNNKDELSKTRDNLSRLINYQEKGFYLLNGNEVPTTDKSVVEDQIYKKIANQYKFPTYKEQTSYKSHMNPVIFNTREVKPTKLFDASARNTGFSYKSRKSDLGNQSNFGNKTFYEKSKIIDKDYISSNTYRELNSFSVFNSKLDRQTANKTCLIGNYLLNTINNLNETLIAKELFKKLSDIDSEDKNKEKLKKLKIWDLNEGYINKIDNEDIKIPQVQIQPQIAPPLSIEINSNNRIFENEDESEEKSKLKAQMEKEEIEKANKLKKSMEAKLISRKEYFSKTEIFLETKLLSLNLKPSCRAQATFTLVDNNIYLFGGIGAGKLNDMWTLEILNNGKKLWKLNNVKGNIPSKRFGHTTVKFNSELIIYGGLSDVDIPKDEIIIYDTTTHTFLCEKTKLSDFSTMRAHHIAQSAGNFMLIYGGVTSKNTPLNDVLLLDLRALVWAEIKTINKKEAAIYNHCSALVVSKDKLSNINFHINMFPEECKKTKLKCEGVYIFGGIEFTQQKGLYYSDELKIIKFGTKPLLWVYPKIKGAMPQARAKSSLNFVEEYNLLVLHGGTNGENIFNDFWVFDLIYWNWAKVNLYARYSNEKLNHCTEVYNDWLLIFGGIGLDVYESSDILEVNMDVFTSNKGIQNDEKKQIDVINKEVKDNSKIGKYEFMKMIAEKIVNKVPVDIDSELNSFNNMFNKTRKFKSNSQTEES